MHNNKWQIQEGGQGFVNQSNCPPSPNEKKRPSGSNFVHVSTISPKHKFGRRRLVLASSQVSSSSVQRLQRRVN